MTKKLAALARMVGEIFAFLITMYAGISAISSGLKIINHECHKSYGMDKIVYGHMFCPLEKIYEDINSGR